MSAFIAFSKFCRRWMNILLRIGKLQLIENAFYAFSSTDAFVEKDGGKACVERKKAIMDSTVLWYIWHLLHFGLLTSVPIVKNRWWTQFSHGNFMHILLPLLSFFTSEWLHWKLFGSDPGTVTVHELRNGDHSLLALPRAPGILIKKGGVHNCGQHGQECHNCGLARPLRSKHCNICNKCIRKYDHHCSWLGTCIGEYNQRDFLFFLLAETILTIAYADAIFQGLPSLRRSRTLAGWLAGNCIAIIALGLLFIFLALLLPHVVMQMVFVLTNQTSWEFFSRGRINYLENVPENVNPFSQGPIKNLYYFCIRRHPNEYHLPALEKMLQTSTEDTIWNNRWYSCF